MTLSAEIVGHPIEVRVVQVLGRSTCPLGMQTGGKFRSDREVGAVCHWAAHTLLPWTAALRFGGDVPWESEPGLARVNRPDPDRSVVFQVRRLAVHAEL